jgi:hypothetical protein
MLTVEMNLSSLIYCLQDLEMLLFIYILFEYGLYLRSSLFRFYKLSRIMSLISLKLVGNPRGSAELYDKI